MDDAVAKILEKLDEQDKLLVQNLYRIAECSLSMVQNGYGSYQLMKAIMDTYTPYGKIDLTDWTK